MSEVIETEILTDELNAGSGPIEEVNELVNETTSNRIESVKNITDTVKGMLTWSPKHASLGKPLFLFYLAVAGNYIGGLFNARVQEIFESNEPVMHLLGFIIFSTTVSAYIDNPTIERVLGYSVVLYTWFELTTRMQSQVLFGFLIVLGLVYFLELRVEELHDRVQNGTASVKEVKFYNMAKRVAGYGNMIAVIITIIGVSFYSDTWKAIDEDNAESLLAKLKL
jgi:hypothetical protein